MNGNPLIDVQGVRKGFAGRPVLTELTFAVGRGEIVGFIGPNGSGKTTTVRLLNGVLAPDAGHIAVGGFDPGRDGDRVRRMSGILTESAGLYGSMTGRENLRFFAELYGVDEPGRVDELLAAFGLADAADWKVAAYSTGMRKRLGLAKAVLHRPEVLFLDEPTNGLDPEGIRMVLGYIRSLNEQEGTTVLICSHLLQQLELVCHRYLFLLGGQVVEQGTLAELEARHFPAVTLEVETDLALTDGRYRGVPARQVRPGRIAFTLPGREDVPGFLRILAQDAAVYSAVPVRRDLETLYFKIMGGEVGE
ncbi:ABC transporter ATP-binding protein [Symbiobacterium thermophilum]|uniref:ABC transporter ATP-binding protein n=1 Tax=Symbiobacterium thermophilum TaxID=2734 RepID=A0A953LI08_SYMTR|nr:ABC transporter ATP-binding protein [Symbiobacterium thermophilum]MBY6275524.1 ABC transporter ATP-binding protein [Symbiobacterium thermophilum]